MQASPESLYLDLMKKTLVFALWPEPPRPLPTGNYRRRSGVKRALITSLVKVLEKRRLQLVKMPDLRADARTDGTVWSRWAHTLVGLKRLDNLQHCVETVLKDGVPGDLIETGVWRGGACIFMRAVLAAYGVTDRTVFAADSFQGLPPPDEATYPVDRGDPLHLVPVLAVSLEEVRENFRKYGLLDDQVVFLKGWFKDTLPAAPVERLSVLRLDGDMYGSTMEALEHLYPKLSEGGFCIIDDYGYGRCKAAVDDYRAAHGIRPPLLEIDWTGRYWRKD